ncbi:hypothetical protein BJV82DRAFT_676396 [Fennellomyces sp. T-0311]|nr:hypothetical protein BJV82DRAFT_676396 [Fennellomyces sp. T-0311]
MGSPKKKTVKKTSASSSSLVGVKKVDVQNEFPLFQDMSNKKTLGKRKGEAESSGFVKRPKPAKGGRRARHSISQIHRGTDEEREFKTGIAQYCFMQNAFPTKEEAHLACTKLVEDIKAPMNPCPIDSDMFFWFDDILSRRRSFLLSGVEDWLSQYHDEIKQHIPDELRSGTKQEICKHLLLKNRFGRTNMDAKGRFLYSQAIIDCICFTLLNSAGGPARLRPFPKFINKYTIALITLMIKCKVAKAAKDPSVAKGAPGSTFGMETMWESIYEGMLTSKGQMAKVIKWTEVEKFITEGVIKKKGNHLTMQSALSLFGSITLSEDEESDTEPQPYENRDEEGFGDECSAEEAPSLHHEDTEDCGSQGSVRSSQKQYPDSSSSSDNVYRSGNESESK